MLAIKADRASGICTAGSFRLLVAGFTAVMLAACAQPSVVSEEPAPSLASPASPRSEASGSPAPVRHAALGSADASSPPARKPAGKRAPAYDIVE